MSILIRNGTIVTPTSVFSADIMSEEGKITAIAKTGLPNTADRIIDAAKCVVTPGVIDSHTHLGMRFAGGETKDGFEMGTKAAAMGGVTTLINYAIADAGGECLNRIDEDLALARRQACIDFGIHGAITEPIPEPIDRLEKYVKLGIPSFKLFTTFKSSGYMSDDGAICRVFAFLARINGMPGVHAENDAITNELTNELVRLGKTKPIYFPRSRPDYAEEEAILRSIYFATLCRSPLYIVHLSTRRALDAVHEHRAKFRRLFVETCPHYLTLTDKKYQGPKGVLYIMSPPLRTQSDVNALWGGLIRGDIDFVSSDHVAFDQDQKDLGNGDFSKARHGVAGIELLPAIIFSEGVVRRKVALQRFVRLTSYNPARILGLFPRKGNIAIGADADLIIIDPRREMTVRASNLHMNVDYSIYEGMKLKGIPTTTISRGEVIVENGEFYGKSGQGQFRERRIDPNLSLDSL